MVLEMTGLAELVRDLRRLPADLAEEGADVADDAVEVTAAQLVQAYPRGDTANLRGGVKVTVERSPFGFVGLVSSTSPHAHLWEFGTQNRETRKGWRRGQARDHEPAGLVPIAERNRRRMYGQLVEILKRAGFEVSGSFD